MAIDYKKEWEELQRVHGAKGVTIPGEGLTIRLAALMKTQIQDTINDREKLMKQYIKERMATDITGANENYHFVRIDTRWGTFGTVAISKKDFDAWCKSKGGK